MKPSNEKRKRLHEQTTSDKSDTIVDLTKEKEEEPTSKKSKTSNSHHNQHHSQDQNHIHHRRSPGTSASSDRQRWIQMGWKPPLPPSTSTARTPPKVQDWSPPSSEVFSHPSQQFRQRFRPNPEDFRAVAASLCVELDVEEEVRGAGKWTRLTRDIVEFFNENQQERPLLDRKIELWTELYKTLHQDMECGLAVTGSTFNGFGGDKADLDMCVYPQGPAVSDKQWLTMTRRLLKKKCRKFIRGDIQLINAKVPILKFYDCVGRLEVDMSVNNPTSSRNTHMLYCYSQLDSRVRPLVLCVKRWAKNNNINEARLQTLSSYTLSLMVIHYLQSGVSPPVLPCLQKLHPQIFNSESDIFSLEYRVPPGYQSANRDPLGKLFVGFFLYFTDPQRFNTNRDVASVREGRVLRSSDCEQYSRERKTGPGQWSAHILIEEPLDRTNAASYEKWNLITAVFNSTADFIVRMEGSTLRLDHFASSNINIGRYL